MNPTSHCLIIMATVSMQRQNQQMRLQRKSMKADFRSSEKPWLH